MKKSAKIEFVRSLTFDKQPPHPLAVLIESDDPPEIVSIGMRRLPDSKDFVYYKIYSVGNQIVRMEVEEQNMRPIIEETAKIAFVKEFMDAKA